MSRTASWLALFPVFVFGLAGCGGASGSSSVQGSVGGKSFSEAHAVANVGGQAQRQSGLVIISSASDICERVTANSEPTNAQLLTLQLREADAAGNSSAPGHSGTYAITSNGSPTSGQFAWAFFVAVGAQTSDSSQMQASGGSVTLTDVADGRYGGSFDLTFGSDHLTGSFDSSNCPALK